MTTVRHDWNVTPDQAFAIQERLRHEVIVTDDLPAVVRTVAGIDVGFEDEGETTRAAIVVLTFPELLPITETLSRRPTTFPYVPGLLSFREIPTILTVLEALKATPDLLLVDGAGIAHPRRLGIASHLGVLTGLPSIGVAKSRLIGRHDPVPDERGAWVPLYDRKEIIGAVLRTRPGTKPLYISPGHRISLPTALEYVMACTTKYRLPETTRAAHRLASLEK